MKQKDHNYSSKFEDDMKKAFKEASNETTSSELDQSILAMAEKHHQQTESLGFFSRIFASKQMKYLLSMSAALVMTVGIARFMVYLGKTDQGFAQSDDMLLAQEAAAEKSLDNFAFEMADAETATPASRQVSAAKKPEPAQIPELVTNEEMRQILSESKSESDSYAKVAKQEKELAEEQLVMVTGARMKRAEAEAAPVLSVTSQTKEGDSMYHAGAMDEAVDMTPKPRAWLQEIFELLEKSHKKQALEEWSQFKNTYPDHQIEPEMLQKLKSMGLDV
ncbi:MAG: hypothetical protein HWE16_18365 [Gammaproteobacteria bacterium]|nr:hypothetical protein [Gammaproteobacteria bacterium]